MMMTTCRLLCALLVLVLCCCPSVCAGDTQPEVDVESSSKTTTTTTIQPPVSKEKSDPKPNLGAVLPLLPPGPSPQGTGQPGMQGNGSAEQPGNNAGDRGSLPGPHPQSSGAHNTVQREGTENGRSGEELSQSQESTLLRAPEKSVEAPTTKILPR
ncbi:mucin TcMUCII [Trypanosoma cruzi cruzi]|uniref:Putative mucin TcMUCII n=1 Tax=Trypanosoma cruzi TaxID=5693 RepID=A0A2V2UST9_TRYCR|nr:mucin TcMUCII [Trypanosoma cruzi cruzi]PWU87130.1 putative mucin TcMUCII [Trypanosoma cruzi]